MNRDFNSVLRWSFDITKLIGRIDNNGITRIWYGT